MHADGHFLAASYSRHRYERKKPPSYGCKVKAGFHLIAAIKQIPVLFFSGRSDSNGCATKELAGAKALNL